MKRNRNGVKKTHDVGVYCIILAVFWVLLGMVLKKSVEKVLKGGSNAVLYCWKCFSILANVPFPCQYNFVGNVFTILVPNFWPLLLSYEQLISPGRVLLLIIAFG